ncbi:YmfQ family protein [Pseudomonas sp. W5-36]|uniref:YmfQ family protein n=1 Tax=Pseudomonas sp. W5-36 TaxID=3097455 RepID=UPI0039782250
MAIRTAAEYLSQLTALLPQGPAWDLETAPELSSVLMGIAQEMARIDTRAVALNSEMDPALVTELVPDWEAVMDLPDACLGLDPSFSDRQKAVQQRLIAVGSQRASYFIAIAKSQGYPNASVTQYRAPRFGRSRFGVSHFGTWSAQFMWTLNTGGRLQLGRRFGASFWGERFGTNAGSSLECLIRRYAPAHTVPHINYS